MMDKFLTGLKSHWGIKIIALVFAFLIWSFVLSDTNPIRDKSFENVTVNITGEETLTANGLVIVGDWTEKLKNMRIDIQVRRDDFNMVTADDFKVSLDLSSIQAPGTYKLRLYVSNNEPTRVVRITGVSVSTIELLVEKKVTREVPVEYRFTGELPAGYWNDVPTLSDNVVAITGPQSQIDKVQKAVCVIDLAGLKTAYNKKTPLRFFDSANKEIETLQLSDGTPSVIARMDVFPYKTVSLDLDSVATDQGSIAAGYRVRGVTADKTSVNIAGPAEKLAQINSIKLGTISVAGARADIVKTLPVKVPDGVTIIDGTTEVRVTVQIAEADTTRRFNGVPVTVRGTAAGGEAELATRTVAVDVTGPRAELTALKASQIQAYVDVDGLAAGEHAQPVVIDLPASLTDLSAKAVPARIQVTVAPAAT
jgi:YbbR domain-containing protein